MKKRQDILLDVTKIAGARYLTRALLLAKTIVVARVLGPSDYGLIGLVLLVPAYGQWTDLGLLGGLVRTLPSLGDDEVATDEKRVLLGTAMTSYGLLASVVTFGVLLAAALVGDPVASGCLVFAAAVIPVQCVYNFLQNHHRTSQEFGIVARSVGLLEMSGLVTTLLLIFIMGAPGFFLAMALSHVIAIVYLWGTYRRSGAGFHLIFDWPRTRALLIAGFPLASTTILHTFFLSLDRAVMSRTVPREVVGHYMIALLVSGIILYVPSSAGYILFPILRERAGQGQADRATLHRYLQEPTETIAWVIVFFIAGAVLMIPVIPEVLPSYQPGLNAARILTLFTFFLAINAVARNHLAALEDFWRPLVVFQVAVAVLAPVLVYGAVRFDLGVDGVALGMGVAYLLYGIGSQVIALRTCQTSLSQIVIDVFYTTVPLVYLVAALEGIDWVLARFEVSGISAAALGVALFVPAGLPLLWGVHKRTPVFDLLLKAWGARRAPASPPS